MMHASFKDLVNRMQERLKSSATWMPYPALISVGLTAILVAQIFTTVNPSLKRAVNPILLESPDISMKNIVVNVYMKNENVIVQMEDGSRAGISPNAIQEEDVESLKALFMNRISKEIRSAIVKRRSYQEQFTAVLAVDQTLKFQHMRPILIALASAGITDYGFQTRNRWAARSSN